MTDASATAPTTILPDFSSPAALRHRRWRRIQDVLTRQLMAIGGLSVIVAILLIAVYLLNVVLPMFFPADIKHVQSYATPGGDVAETLYYGMEEQRELGLRVTSDGNAIFFRARTGEVVRRVNMLGRSPAPVTAFGAGDSSMAAMAFGLADGSVQVFRHVYHVSYHAGHRVSGGAGAAGAGPQGSARRPHRRGIR
jgi:phosphate transport system permease protein